MLLSPKIGANLRRRSVRGIPCRLGPAAATAVETVLDRVQFSQPEDYERLLRVVKVVVPLSPEDAEDGTVGEWKKGERPVDHTPRMK